MFVKVSKGDGGWLLIGNVKNVEYPASALQARSGVELKALVNRITGEAAECVIENALIQIDPFSTPRNGAVVYKFSVLTAKHEDGSKTVILHDHPVYVCGDNGATMERINVR